MDKKLKNEIKKYLKIEFADAIREKLEGGYKLDKFIINPLVLTALSSGVFGKTSSLNMAKALLYPRVLGTSISTSFGDKMQKLCVSYLGANASSTPGMDLEFIDKIDGKKVLMQLKAGPNTINSGDVEPIVSEMNSAYRLLQTNKVGKNMPLFAVGIVYGSMSEISGHYKKIADSPVGAQAKIPIYIGKDFWHRLTGQELFYRDLINLFIEVFDEEDYSDLLETDLKLLSAEIEGRYFTKHKFDPNKL
ncbi:MAG: PmeII family type II restriction endonuclease [Candidatus Doudnabacteria bacterium]|nr:PmeII family type II restriction endonuclease [Candidatus Doudnabacteria bacterium]